MARLTTEKRNALPTKSFAGPNRSYPINDASHARNALARVSQHGSAEEKKQVRAAVAKKYPGIGKGEEKGETRRDNERRESAHFPPLSRLARR